MLSLIWKDFVAARRLLLLLVIPLGGVQLAVMASVPPIYPIAALSYSALLAFGSIAVEETQRTELLWNSLPVTRGAFVTARYLVALIGMTVGLTFGWAIAQLTARHISIGALGPATFTSFTAHVLMYGMLVLAAAVFLPLHFRFGTGRAVMLFLAVTVGAVVVISLVAELIMSAKGYPSPIFDPEAWRRTGPALSAQLIEWLVRRRVQLLVLFLSCSFLSLAFSWVVARRLFATRDL
jgi:ABC-type transport system involved in multi-copper enzyme maturation permease subunit